MLPMVMCKVVYQHKTIIMARRIVDEDEDNTREAQLSDNAVRKMSQNIFFQSTDMIIQHLTNYVAQTAGKRGRRKRKNPFLFYFKFT